MKCLIAARYRFGGAWSSWRVRILKYIFWENHDFFLLSSGGHSTFFGFVNTAVHVVIYTYLILITVYPQTRKYFFWWKKFYPIFQIAQFAIVFVHALQLVWKNDCNYPFAFVFFIGGHAVLFYLLVKNKMVRFDANDNLCKYTLISC